MSPYSSAHYGEQTVRQGGVCVHDRSVTRCGIRYYLGSTPYFYWWVWQHDDDHTECLTGPASSADA